MPRGFLLLLALVLSQSPQPSFKSHTELVALNVTVTDAQGNVVRGLTRDAFAVSEDGARRSITQFAAESVPLSLVVALDASLSMGGRRIEYARQAVLRLLDRLNPDDEFFVFGFNHRVFNITSGTKNRDEVARALSRVHPAPETALYDAIRAGVQVLDRAQHRRRALVVISDGNDAVPASSEVQWGLLEDAREAAAIETVRRTEALVYAIGVNPPGGGGLQGVNIAALDRLTKPTGGDTVAVTSDEAITTAAERLGDELRLQYVLGFLPAHQDGKFHRVEVKVIGCDKCRARARAGFVAGKASR